MGTTMTEPSAPDAVYAATYRDLLRVAYVLIPGSGVDIGKVVAPIKKGEHLHVHNVKTKRW